MTNPISLIILIISGVLLVGLKREHAFKPLLVGITFVPYGFVLNFGVASFNPVRILVFFGMLRIIFRREKLTDPFNATDRWFIFLTILLLITAILRPPSLDTTIVTRLGNAYDLIGGYFVLRYLIHDYKDIYSIIQTTVIIFSVLVIFMAYEKIKCFNPFYYLGSRYDVPIIRDGKIRCSGPFAISILAGTVPATTLVWMYILRWQKKIPRIFLYLGIAAGVAEIFLCASSGPIMSLLLLITGFCIWPLRNKMRMVRWGIVVLLFLLQMAMKAPIWFIFAKIDLTGSSTGWHRSELIDSAFRHWNEWWIIGTNYTRHWMPTGVSWSPYQSDITNQYLRFGVDGGLFAMLCFIFIIVSCFKALGQTLKSIPDTKFNYKITVWALGASLFSHTVTFFSVRYFDQSFFYFLLLLAMIRGVYNSRGDIEEELSIENGSIPAQNT